MNPDSKKVSKSMSYVLRHKPDAIGITLDPNGWVDVDVLIAAFQRNGKRYTPKTTQNHFDFYLLPQLTRRVKCEHQSAFFSDIY